MPGVYAQGLCTMQSQPSIHSLSPGERGLGIGIENFLYFYKYRLFLQTDADEKIIGVFVCGEGDRTQDAIAKVSQGNVLI